MPSISKASLMGAAGVGGFTFDENDVVLIPFDDTGTNGSYYDYVTDASYGITNTADAFETGFGPLADLTNAVGASAAGSVVEFLASTANYMILTSADTWTVDLRMYDIDNSPGNGVWLDFNGTRVGVYSDTISSFLYHSTFGNVRSQNLFTAAAWHHLAVQYNGNGTYSGYVDGTLIGGSVYTAASFSGTAAVRLGSRPSTPGNGGLPYAFCDLRVSKTARYPTTGSNFTPSTVRAYQDQY